MNNVVTLVLRMDHVLVTDTLRGGTLKIINLTPDQEDSNPLVDLMNSLEEGLNERYNLIFHLEGQNEITFKDCRVPIFGGSVVLENVFGPITSLINSEIRNVDFRPANLSQVILRNSLMHTPIDYGDERNVDIFFKFITLPTHKVS